MSTTRLQELLGKIVVGVTLTLVEREELLQFMLKFAVNEKLVGTSVIFTLHGFNVTRELYDDVCLILKSGKYYDEYAGQFRNNNKIKAIKLIRERLVCGLKEAKDICEDKHFPAYGQY
mgnify:CR=1 FL=1